MRLRRRGASLEGPVRALRTFVVPALATLLMLLKVAELGRDTLAVRLAETVLWVFVIIAFLSFFNAVVFGQVAEGSWQARIPKLLRDLLQVLLVLIGGAIVLSRGWGVDLGGLLTALGVGSIVLGLALQEPLGNLFSGIMLMIERPFAVGDWIRVGGTVGKVIETNWRAVHILPGLEHEVRVIPNGELGKGSFDNLSRPTRVYAAKLALSFSYDDPPNKVKRVLRETALRTPGVLEDPPPSVRTSSYDDFSVAYGLYFRVADYAELANVWDELLTRIWYVAKRHGLTMPYPISTQIEVEKAELEAAERSPVPADALRAFPQLGLARPEALGSALTREAVKQYARGERIVAEGEFFAGLHLLLSGQVTLSVRDTSGQEKEVGRLARGEYFGEKALLSGSTSEVTVTALDDVEILVLDGANLQALLDQTPRAVREIGNVMEARRQTIRKARSAARAQAASASPEQES
ncbi:MAG: cyclic nucleotide-binding domain-containing protein [Chromatiales bacterium]